MSQAEAGKGSRPRPFSVTQEEYANRWDAIFRRDGLDDVDQRKENMQEQKQVVKESGVPCGCGRSPTGKCIGWHSLSEEEFQRRLAEHQARQTS
jgi:hypothetical protein